MLDKKFGPFEVTPQGGTHTETYAVKEVKITKLDGNQVEVVDLKDGKPSGDPYYILPSAEGSRLNVDGRPHSVYLRGRRVTRGDLRADMIVTLAEPRTFANPRTPEHKRIAGHRYEPFVSHMDVVAKLNKGPASKKFQRPEGQEAQDELAKLRRENAELRAMIERKPEEPPPPPADDKKNELPKGGTGTEKQEQRRETVGAGGKR